MLPRRLRWRPLRQQSHGRLRLQHRRSTRLWPWHMRHLLLNRHTWGLGDAITFDEVRGCLRSLTNHKAEGCDGIPEELFKCSGGTGVQVLTHLFNAVLATRPQCVPSAWRLGIVVHLPKAGNAGDCYDCRPLTLLPIVDKLFAKLLRSALYVLCACMTHNTPSALAGERSIRYRTCWRLCCNEPRRTKPCSPDLFKRRKLMTQWRNSSAPPST